MTSCSKRIPTLPWRFGCLWPTAHPQAVDNDHWLGGQTLGIEVTDAALARRCGLGNIDPQHGSSVPTLAAVDLAACWPLPPDGSSLVTLRADADSIGTMARLLLRRQKRDGSGESPSLRRRARLISRADRLERGPWALWRAAQTAQLDFAGRASDDLAAIHALVRMTSLSIAERVLALAQWLADGDVLPAAAAVAKAHAKSLAAALASGEVSIAPVAEGPIARLVARRAAPVGGMQLAYRTAPIVLAEGWLPTGRKLTIAQFDPSWLDMGALLRDLKALEPGWGGSSTIIGSPQGVGCVLDLDAVQDRILCHLSTEPGRANLHGQNWSFPIAISTLSLPLADDAWIKRREL